MPSQAEFLSAVWGTVEGVAELTTIGKGKPKPIRSYPFDYPKGLDTFVFAARRHAEPKNVNVYYGLLIRKAGTRIGFDPKEKVGHRGTEADAAGSRIVWCEIDFAFEGGAHKKGVSRDDALTLVRAFPLRPSIVVSSGGGVHLLWLLREPVFGDDLKRVKAINIALAKTLMSDPQSVDLARVLRVPGTTNINHAQPLPCEVTPNGWHPERIYSLDDFDFLPFESEPDPVAMEEPPPSGEREIIEERKDLPEPKIEKISKYLLSLWTQGWKHECALDVAGAFAHAGVSLRSTREVVRRVSDAVQGDTESRLRDVEDTFRRYAEGKPIRGFDKLEERVDSAKPEEFPGGNKEAAKKALSSIRSLMPHLKKKRVANFEITKKIVEVNADPRRYTITIRRKDGIEFTVAGEGRDVTEFKKFRQLCLGKADKNLNTIDEDTWGQMFEEAPTEEHEVEQEMSPDGIITLSVADFIKDAREAKAPGDLVSFAVSDDTEHGARVSLKIEALGRFVKGSWGRSFPERTIAGTLKRLGWRSKAARFPWGVTRVWSLSTNGSANGNGDSQELFDKTPKRSGEK